MEMAPFLRNSAVRTGAGARAQARARAAIHTGTMLAVTYESKATHGEEDNEGGEANDADPRAAKQEVVADFVPENP